MARLYLDENMSKWLIPSLARLDHDVTSVDRQQQKGISDAILPRDAVRHRRVFIAHNGGHIELLHEAWHAWSAEWNVADIARHAGILLLRPTQEIDAMTLAEVIDRLLRDVQRIDNRLFRWNIREDWHEVT